MVMERKVEDLHEKSKVAINVARKRRKASMVIYRRFPVTDFI